MLFRYDSIFYKLMNLLSMVVMVLSQILSCVLKSYAVAHCYVFVRLSVAVFLVFWPFPFLCNMDNIYRAKPNLAAVLLQQCQSPIHSR